MDFHFSDEQSVIIDCSKNEKNVNVVVDAVAGSGKTTTICGILQQNMDSKVLILTYNRHLCQETLIKLQLFGLENGEIYTVHGFVYTYYNNSDYTDRIIRDTLKHDLPLKKQGVPYDIVVLDEFQDFNMHMLQSVIKYIRDVMLTFPKWKPRIFLLGDKYQCVYSDLHGSDNRFLIHAPSLFHVFGEWKRFSLQTTYRLTEKMTEFINKAILRSNFFISDKVGQRKPVYIVTDPYSEMLHLWLYDFIRQHRYKPDDIFILAPSIKNGNAPVYRLTNYLSERGYPIFYSNQYEDVCNVKETENKVTVNTYHVCKGRERPLVIVFNFDSSYFQWFAKDKSMHDCTNPQYVSFTRGLEDLVLIQSRKESPLPFMDIDEMKKTCQVLRINSSGETSTGKSTVNPQLSVTELLDYQTFDVIHYADQFYSCTVQQTKHIINLPSFVKAKIMVEIDSGKVDTVDTVGTVAKKELEVLENVSNLNGNLITLINEYNVTGKVELLNNHDFVGIHVSRKNSDVRKLVAEMKSSKCSIRRKLVNASLLMEAESTGATHRLRQITNKNWLTNDHWENIVKVFTDAMGSNVKDFEMAVIDSDVIRGKKLYGRVDVIDHEKKIIYECKWVSKVTDVHKIQLIIYYYLLTQLNEKYFDYKLVLMNFRDGMRYELQTVDDIFPLIDYLVFMKFATEPSKSYEELERCTKEMIDLYFDKDSKPKHRNVEKMPVIDKSVKKKPAVSTKQFRLLVESDEEEEIPK